MNFRCTFRQLLYHALLYLRGLCHNIVIDRRRRRKVELVGGLNICRFFEQGPQLRQIEELAEACTRPISRTFWGQFDGALSFTEGGRPAIEVGKPLALNGVMLKIPHHGVKLRHGV